VQADIVSFGAERNDHCGVYRVKVYDGGNDSAWLLKIICDSNFHYVFTSTGSSLLVKFISYKNDTKSGISVKYSTGKHVYFCRIIAFFVCFRIIIVM